MTEYNKITLDQLPARDKLRELDPKQTNQLFEFSVNTPAMEPMGDITLKSDLESTEGPFKVLHTYKPKYPASVTQAISNIYQEYNHAFTDLVRLNMEAQTDYKYNLTPSGTPVNRWVQVDMVGLPDNFLRIADDLDPAALTQVIKAHMFEIENSLAMYQLLSRMFSSPGEDRMFGKSLKSSLMELREQHNRPVALLAVTEEKYRIMMEAEFGVTNGNHVEPGKVFDLSGFDAFFGPSEFRQLLEDNDGECPYLLYVRSSLPVSKLKNPDIPVNSPLLENTDIRRVIRENALTFNVDNPNLPPNSPKTINDTKAYQPAMGMSYATHSEGDVFSVGFVRHVEAKKPAKEYNGRILSDGLMGFLESKDIVISEIETGTRQLRFKPMQESYGCYGHVSGSVVDKRVRQDLRKGLRQRGPYVVQPELACPIITNTDSGESYTYIDRNFFSTDGNSYKFMGGFRSLMPINSAEAHKGRNHGSTYTVWAEITD
jgi:hypothetical protein